MTAHHPTRPTRLAWIKRRARRIQKFYGVSRRLAIVDAALDFTLFIGAPL